jgi:NitT/TauT family transport system permease protein
VTGPSRSQSDADGAAPAPAPVNGPERVRHSPWKALFTFGARARPVLEFRIGVAAFAVVIGTWLLATEGASFSPHSCPRRSPSCARSGACSKPATSGTSPSVWAASGARSWSAAVLAIPLAILMSSYRGIGAFSEPLVDFVRYLPVPALVPLTLIWLGIGEASKIALLWIGTFFQLVLLVADDARRVPKEFIETGRTLGANDFALMKDVLIRAMAPGTVDSLRITLGWCWTYLLIAEIVASNSGIGYELWTARRYGKTPEVFAGILTIGIIGLASDQAIRALHRRLFRYLG